MKTEKYLAQYPVELIPKLDSCYVIPAIAIIDIYLATSRIVVYLPSVDIIANCLTLAVPTHQFMAAVTFKYLGVAKSASL